MFQHRLYTANMCEPQLKRKKYMNILSPKAKIKLWTITWTPRQANVAADTLAKMAAKSGVSFSFDYLSAEGIPSALLDFILLQEGNSPLM